LIGQQCLQLLNKQQSTIQQLYQPLQRLRVNRHASTVSLANCRSPGFNPTPR
jgi:hypothetical protein